MLYAHEYISFSPCIMLATSGVEPLRRTILGQVQLAS